MKRIAMLICLALAGCGGDDASRGGADAGRSVVATTAVVADLSRGLGVEPDAVLVPPGADAHDHEIRPSDVEALAEADVVIRSGGEIDEWLDGALRSAGSDPEVVTLLDFAEQRGGAAEHADSGGHGGVDPHWWHDPRNAIAAARGLARRLDVDPAAYGARLRRLDRTIAACVATVPREDRKLVTTHDALGYFAARYGFEVVGTVIPSRSTQGQASAGEIAELVRTVKAAGVPTIFTESSVSSDVEEQVAREAGAKLGPALAVDTLGEGQSYEQAMTANARAIAEGLGGSCSR